MNTLENNNFKFNDYLDSLRSKKVDNYQEELSQKTKEFEESRKEQGNLKLNNVKKEAGELYKSKMATSENIKNQNIRNAEEKKKDAVDSITKYFLDHIK